MPRVDAPRRALDGLHPPVLLLGHRRSARRRIDVASEPAAHYRSLWVYIHLRDIARAYRLACETEGIEHETFYVVASDIRSGVPTAELVERFYPGVPLKRPMGDVRRADRERPRARGARLRAASSAGATRSRRTRSRRPSNGVSTAPRDPHAAAADALREWVPENALFIGERVGGARPRAAPAT